MLLRKIHFLAVIAFLLALSGCASYPQYEVPKVDNMPDVSRYENKPSVFVDFRFYQGKPENPGVVEITRAKDELRPRIEEAIRSSNLFSKYTFDEFAKEGTDYTIRVYGYNHGETGGAAVLGFISGLTFGIIPAVATDEYTLALQLVDNQQNLIKSYSNKDSINTWIGIWFIPMMGNSPIKAVNETLENQVRDALRQLVESNSLNYSQNHLFYPAVPPRA